MTEYIQVNKLKRINIDENEWPNVYKSKKQINLYLFTLSTNPPTHFFLLPIHMVFLIPSFISQLKTLVVSNVSVHRFHLRRETIIFYSTDIAYSLSLPFSHINLVSFILFLATIFRLNLNLLYQAAFPPYLLSFYVTKMINPSLSPLVIRFSGHFHQRG